MCFHSIFTLILNVVTFLCYFCLCCRHFLLFCFTPASGQIYRQHTCYHHCIDHFLSHFFFASLCRLSQFPLIAFPDFCTVHIPDKENAGSYGFCHTLPHFFHFYVLFLMLVFLMLLFQILYFPLLHHLFQLFWILYLNLFFHLFLFFRFFLNRHEWIPYPIQLNFLLYLHWYHGVLYQNLFLWSFIRGSMSTWEEGLCS